MAIPHESKVFVVDDDASVRVALGRLIRSAGLEVETFASAEDLLEAWPSGPSGCLILTVPIIFNYGSRRPRCPDPGAERWRSGVLGETVRR